ncbi:MAG: FHA domain-containing protein, partial [Singulisphaera sp.]
MATLEVHHGRNRVERVTISRDHPILFGSNPKCDIVIDGPGVVPYHGRLRWKSSGYYKVDASTEGTFVEVNGRKVRSAPYKQGDEIQLGGCRIFMIQGEDERLEEAPGANLRTGQESPARGPRSRPASPGPDTHPTANRGRAPSPEDLREATEIHHPETASGPTPTSRAVGPAPGLVQKGRRFLNVLTGRDRAPGRERILSSPLVLVLVGSLVALVFLGVTLQGIIAKTVATRLYNRALESLGNGDHRNAMRQFDEFLASEPAERDPRTSKARVFRALADVRQYTATTGASWSNALMASRNMVDAVGREPAYRDVSTELAELVIKTGEALADRARIAAEAPLVAEAESALALHARVAGKAAGPMLTRSRLPAKLAEARAAVLKRQARERGLAAIGRRAEGRLLGGRVRRPRRPRRKLCRPGRGSRLDLTDDPRQRADPSSGHVRPVAPARRDRAAPRAVGAADKPGDPLCRHRQA